MNAGIDLVGAEEVRHYSIDCNPWLREGEVVLSATVEITPESSPEFSIPFTYVQSDRYVTFFTNGGVTNESYEALFTIVLSYQRRTLCVQFRVVDSCGVGVAL